MNINIYIMFSILSCIVLIYMNGCSSEQEATSQSMSQFPSPMTNSVRVHERIDKKKVPGASVRVNNVLTKPVEVYVASQGRQLQQTDLLIHFHGSSYIPQRAVYDSKHTFILAVVNLGSGSSVYENAFQEESVFLGLVESIRTSVSELKATKVNISGIYLSSFSAGYGAIRAILKNHLSLVDGIILLDGLHTNYIPARRILSQGGKLNEEKLRDFLQFARLAIDGEKRFLITHSEIFPGTYASTTETADFIINSLNLYRHPVLRWGPVGMQLLSETDVNGLTILGFAGNSAPDHIDHFHGLPTFLQMILDK